MALSAASVFEVRTGGSDTNGGGFVTGASGTDYSLQNAANSAGSNISTADAVGNASTTITSATAAFTSAIVGNIIYLQGGTGSLAAGRYQVTTFTNSTTIVVDRAVATGTGITMNIGGALASLGGLGAVFNASVVTGMIGYFKNEGTNFSITSATANIAGGTFSTATANTYHLIGYQTNRTFGNTDSQPTIQIGAAVSTATMFTMTNTASSVRNFILDGNNQTSAKLSAGNIFYDCTFLNFKAASGSGSYYNCVMTTCAAAVMTGTIAAYCEAYANTATPIIVTNAFKILTYSNTGASTDGISFTASSSYGQNITSVANGRHGIISNAQIRLIDCYAQSNTNTGIITSTAQAFLKNCGAYNNGTNFNVASNLGVNVGSILPSADVFNNLAGNDYSLNSTANAGALLRNAGYPTTWGRGLTAEYMDVGAARHIDPTTSSSEYSSVFG